MGSCDGYTVCPQCGSVMVYNCWYHSSSYVYDCKICGFHGRKMIYYEDCLSRTDEGVDVDGYSRSCVAGHGVVYTVCKRAILKQADDTQIPVDKDDELCYETWVKDGRLQKIKLTQAGLSKLSGMHIVMRDGKKYLAPNADTPVRRDHVQSVINSVTMPDEVLDIARKNECWYYLRDDASFYQAVDAMLNHTGFFGGFFGGNPDEEKIAECKERFMKQYKENTGKDFDFEALIARHASECPKYGLEHNVCVGNGLEVEIDMTDVHEYYGVMAQKSGEILCFADSDAAYLYMINLIMDFFRTGINFHVLNDYSRIHVKDGVVTERSAFRYEYFNQKCKLEDLK